MKTMLHYESALQRHIIGNDVEASLISSQYMFMTRAHSQKISCLLTDIHGYERIYEQSRYRTSWHSLYTVSQKTAQLWNGI